MGVPYLSVYTVVGPGRITDGAGAPYPGCMYICAWAVPASTAPSRISFFIMRSAVGLQSCKFRNASGLPMGQPKS